MSAAVTYAISLKRARTSKVCWIDAPCVPFDEKQLMGAAVASTLSESHHTTDNIFEGEAHRAREQSACFVITCKLSTWCNRDISL